MALACALLTACSSASKPPSPEPVVTVQIARAKIQAISEIVTAAGTLYPLHQASLSPKISAPVRAFYANRGDRVRRGQLLAVLENKDLAAAATAAEGAYDRAQANYRAITATTLPEQLQTAELNVESAQSNLQAQQKLYDSNLWLYQQHALARKQLDQAEVALTAARTQSEMAKKRLDDLRSTGIAEQTNSAQGQLESAHGQYLAAQAQLQYSELRSPMDGVVADRSVYPGEMAAAGTPLMTVMDVSRVVTRLHVPQTAAALLHLGDPANIQIAGLRGGIPGKITVFSPALDPNSTTVEIWVEASNSGHRLEPGTACEVLITAQVVPHALVIPSSALLTASDGTASVMVVRPDGRAYHQRVTTGIQEHGLTQILSGLQAGAEMVATGAYGLPDKTKVSAQPASASDRAAASGTQP